MLLRGPIVAVMLPLNRPFGAGDPSCRQERRGRAGRSAMQQTSNLGAMDRAGKRVGRIISVTAFPWITRSWPTYAMGPDFTDAMIGMAAVLLFAIPPVDHGTATFAGPGGRRAASSGGRSAERDGRRAHLSGVRFRCTADLRPGAP